MTRSRLLKTLLVSMEENRVDLRESRGQMTGGREAVRSGKGPGRAGRPRVGPSVAGEELGRIYHKQSSHTQRPYSALPTHSFTRRI